MDARMKINAGAGKPATDAQRVDVNALIAAYYSRKPDYAVVAQRISFGTSGHRGGSLEGSFNESHVLAISQAVCAYRAAHGMSGPLFLAFDTHALSRPALDTTLEVLAANGVQTMIAVGDEFTPTPALSMAIVDYNRGRTQGLADGIVLTPSHNPPDSGGFKYNPASGGPADTVATDWIQAHANALLESRLRDVKRMPIASARAAATTHQHDFLTTYVNALAQVIDFDVIRASAIRMGVDPLGGAGVNYWTRIADHYRLNLTVVSTEVDPAFGFMSLDWDGKIRMDPSSRYAMQRLIGLKDRYDVAFACDPDHDRHGIVTPSAGLMPSNDYLAVAIDYLFQHRPHWKASAAIGKTVVSSAMIDRVAKDLGRRLYEVPVGFKWFVDGLLSGDLGFGGEESAGASFCRLDGSCWTTDKDGLVPALLSAEITARTGSDPGLRYRKLTEALGEPSSDRVEAHATPEQKKLLSRLSPSKVRITTLAGDAITQVIDRAPGNDAAIGGIKVITENGWFAARPSGTEDIYKVYGESFRGQAHLRQILDEAQVIVDSALADV
jgi:phosphoglucomutase